MSCTSGILGLTKTTAAHFIHREFLFVDGYRDTLIIHK